MSFVQITDIVLVVLSIVSVVFSVVVCWLGCVKFPGFFKHWMTKRVGNDTRAQHTAKVIAVFGINCSWWGFYNHFGFEYTATLTLAAIPAVLILGVIEDIVAFEQA